MIDEYIRFPATCRLLSEVTVLGPSRPTSHRANAKPFAMHFIAAVVGVVARVAYIQLVAPHGQLFPDSGWYFWQAQNLRHGLGYVYSAKLGATPSPLVRATEPSDRVLAAGVPAVPRGGAEPVRRGPPHITARRQGGGDGHRDHRDNRTARAPRSPGDRSVSSPLLVAVSPLVIAADGSLMSETIYIPLVLLALLLARGARAIDVRPVVCARRDDRRCDTRAAGRAVAGRGRGCARRGAGTAVGSRPPAQLTLGLGALALVLAPWVVGDAIKMHEPTISTLSSAAPAGANCDVTYSGPEIGWWDYKCTHPELLNKLSEAQYARRITRYGLSYGVGHMNRLPVVLAARFGRTWGLWDPVNAAKLERVQSRNYNWQLFTVAGLAGDARRRARGWRILARRHRPIAMLIAPAVMTTVITLAGYGNTRASAAPRNARCSSVSPRCSWSSCNVSLRAAAPRWPRPCA